MKKNKKQFWMHSAVLIGMTFLLLLLPVGQGRFFGSDGDWYSQHTAIADSLRQVMLETESVLPQYMPLGGGSSIYDFSYYGLLRPDVLFSCLIPQADMRYIVAAYAILGVGISVWFCYIWLCRYGLNPDFSFAGAVFFACSTCFYQAHHQIMFVNYMPFLMLALLGVERVLEKKKSGLLTIALFFVYIHSFYYSISCLFAVGAYALHRMLQKKEWHFGRLFLAVFVSVGMALVFLLPTGLGILSTSKDGGRFAEEAFRLIDWKLEGLLYSPYGCGMTLVTLLALVISLFQKGRRFLSGTLLVCMLCPGVWLVLNGFLYARAKILIPCVPLLALVTAETLEQFRVRKRALALLLTVSFAVSFCVHMQGDFLEKSDKRQEIFTKEEIAEIVGEGNYRFENIANSFVNSNVLPSGKVNRASMYSSVTNDVYADFFYNTMGNAVSANNRVALIPGKNPCFLYFMGVRYILAAKHELPQGYVILKEKGDYVLAENKNVLPICYGTDRLVSIREYQEVFRQEEAEAFFDIRSLTQFQKSVCDGGNHRLFLKYPLSGKILAIRFHVENSDGKEVEITFNGVKNKLSADTAPYPNENHDFIYLLESGEDMRELLVKATKGTYEISGLEVYTADEEILKGMQAVIPGKQRDSGAYAGGISPQRIYSGSIAMKKDGYFVTTYPYREGYRILVDGHLVDAKKVNGAFVGFPVSAGEHVIEIGFLAPGYPVGLLGSILFWLFFGVLRVLEWKSVGLKEKKKVFCRTEESEVVVLKYL